MLEIDRSDIEARLRFDNPWWHVEKPAPIAYQDTPRRRYFAPFQRRVTDTTVRRAVLLMGPRRVGKTVMVYHSVRALLDQGIDARRILYVSLETPVYTGLSLERLLGYFQELFSHRRDTPLFVYFDEIQYLRDWEVHLKSLVDSYPAYRFIATGSAAAALRLKSNESGAGRFSDFILPPLTFAEYLGFIGREAELVGSVADTSPRTRLLRYHTTDIDELNAEFVNYLNFGGYPEAVFSESIRHDPNQYIKSDIIDKVLLRDLPSLYGISDIQELNRLFTTLAYNTGNEVSLDGLSKSSGVAKNTIRRYLEYLEAAFLIRRVERIDQNARRFKRAMCFKVYLTNPSMRTALFGRVTADDKSMGALTETAIFSQWQHGGTVDLYYARWPTGEIDLVHLDNPGQSPAWAVEIKWSDRLHRVRAELAPYVDFVRRHATTIRETFIVTSRTVTEGPFDYEGIDVLFFPSSLYAYLLGVNAMKRFD